MAVDPAAVLRAIKLLHTAVWAVLVAVIIAVPRNFDGVWNIKALKPFIDVEH